MSEAMTDMSVLLVGFVIVIVAITLLIALVIAIYEAIKIRSTAVEILRKLPKMHDGCWLTGMEFSEFFNDLFMWPDDYIIDTGNWENVNMAVMESFAEKVRTHPILFAIFFHY